MPDTSQALADRLRAEGGRVVIFLTSLLKNNGVFLFIHRKVIGVCITY